MSRATMLRNSVRAGSPFLYAAGFVLVMIADVGVAILIERTIGFYDRGGDPLKFITLRHNGDIVSAAATLIIGGAVFGLLASVLVRLERLPRPTIGDHLRHCTALYPILGTLIILLLATHENQAAHGVSLGYGVAMAAFFAAGYAIVVDALILWWQREKYARASSGGAL